MNNKELFTQRALELEDIPTSKSSTEPPSKNDIYAEIVKSLKADALNLNKMLTTAQMEGDFRKSIDIMRNLKDTLELIQKYDWQLMYSNYGSKDNENEDFHREVAVWEQNTEGNIRNHKFWTVGEVKFNTIKNESDAKLYITELQKLSNSSTSF